MLFVAQTNLIALLVGLVIGLVVAFWIFKDRRRHPSPVRSADASSDTHVQETPLP